MSVFYYGLLREDVVDRRCYQGSNFLYNVELVGFLILVFLGFRIV